jgi:hypothetical protein
MDRVLPENPGGPPRRNDRSADERAGLADRGRIGRPQAYHYTDRAHGRIHPRPAERTSRRPQRDWVPATVSNCVTLFTAGGFCRPILSLRVMAASSTKDIPVTWGLTRLLLRSSRPTLIPPNFHSIQSSHFPSNDTGSRWPVSAACKLGRGSEGLRV